MKQIKKTQAAKTPTPKPEPALPPLDLVIRFDGIHKNTMFTDGKGNFYVGDENAKPENLDKVTLKEAAAWAAEREKLADTWSGDLIDLLEAIAK